MNNRLSRAISFQSFLNSEHSCNTHGWIGRMVEFPVLKINNHASGGWRAKDILRGPKSLETKKLGSSKG